MRCIAMAALALLFSCALYVEDQKVGLGELGSPSRSTLAAIQDRKLRKTRPRNLNDQLLGTWCRRDDALGSYIEFTKRSVRYFEIVPTDNPDIYWLVQGKGEACSRSDTLWMRMVWHAMSEATEEPDSIILREWKDLRDSSRFAWRLYPYALEGDTVLTVTYDYGTPPRRYFNEYYEPMFGAAEQGKPLRTGKHRFTYTRCTQKQLSRAASRRIR